MASVHGYEELLDDEEFQSEAAKAGGLEKAGTPPGKLDVTASGIDYSSDRGFVAARAGTAAAAKSRTALNTLVASPTLVVAVPVVGGNVSLYNEGGEGPIYPTPVVGMVGELPDAARAGRLGFAREGDVVAIVSATTVRSASSSVPRNVAPEARG